MIRAVGNKRLDLSEQEYEYFTSIKDTIGEDDFRGLFKSDNDGSIVAITPPLNKKVNMVCLFFLLNVTMNQRLRGIDSGISAIKDLEKRIKVLEETINNDNL